MRLDESTKEQCQGWEASLAREFDSLKAKKLSLDMTRGKPSSEQLNLSDQLDGILQGNYTASDNTDTRNYGGLDGLPECKQLGADLLGVDPSSILVGGNSSLQLMFQAVLTGLRFGLGDSGSAWEASGKVKFLCPSPGYDRHFSITETLEIEMITVPMLSSGPDMDAIEEAVKSNPSIKGLWCVPKYSNPTGIVFDDETVERAAKLGAIAGAGFRVFWDNAYAVHDLGDQPQSLANIANYCKRHGTEDSVIQFASTSKITHAGAGIAFLSASPSNLAAIKKLLAIQTIGPDKVNQLRHCKLLPNIDAARTLMKKHAALLRPRFEAVLKKLSEAFGKCELGSWKEPQGGYFVCFEARQGCAKEIVKLAAEAGVKLTPAGATYPYGNDPEDKIIRIAPSVPSVAEIKAAMEVFVVAVKLASVRKKLKDFD